MSSNESLQHPTRVRKSDAEWREELSPEEYRITRQQGTHRFALLHQFSVAAQGQHSVD